MQKRPDGAGRRFGGAGGSSLGDVMAIGGGIGRRDPAPPRPVTLPTVSIVNTDETLSETDYRAGLRALREHASTAPARSTGAGLTSGR